MSRLLLLTSAVALLGAVAPAQLGPDPRDQLRQIAEKVAEEMKEIDRLLMARDAGKETAAALERSVGGLEKMLEGAQTSNKRVQQGIDELIEQLSKCGLCNGGGEGEGEKPQDGEPQDRNTPSSPRQENPTPDMMQQSQPQPGQTQPAGGQENPTTAENRRAAKDKADDGTEVAERGREVSEWGNLPDYLGAIKQRGGVPEVSEKYRKLYDAYLRAQSRSSDPKTEGK
jgi:hypothetical protein